MCKIMNIILQALFGFVGVWLGHKLSINQADKGRRKEYALNELDAYQKRTFSELERILTLPHPLRHGNNFLEELVQKEKNKEEILAYVTETEDKVQYISSLILANGIGKGRADEFCTTWQNMYDKISGDNFNEASWWTSSSEEMAIPSTNHNKVINDIKLELLGANVKKRHE